MISADTFFIIFDIALGSFMALLGVLAYGKTKKISYLFFVIDGVFLYINMVARVLGLLNILILQDFLVAGIPLFYYLSNDLPFVFLSLGFVVILIEK